jgi:hypothetical protein
MELNDLTVDAPYIIAHLNKEQHAVRVKGHETDQKSGSSHTLVQINSDMEVMLQGGAVELEEINDSSITLCD